MKYALEDFEDVWEEIRDLTSDHYKEVEIYKDIPLSPNLDAYFMMMSKNGSIRSFTVRDKDDFLVGYQIFILSYSIHCSSSLQALQDVLYIAPSHRGSGHKFINWCDEQLKNDGVQIVMQDIRASNNFGVMLERRCGYKPLALLYAKRLDKIQ